MPKILDRKDMARRMTWNRRTGSGGGPSSLDLEKADETEFELLGQ